MNSSILVNAEFSKIMAAMSWQAATSKTGHMLEMSKIRQVPI
jgi:hypothetical protein